MEEQTLSGITIEEKGNSMNRGESDMLTLSQLKPGEQGRVMVIEGGRGIRQKLFLRGLFEGSVVRVISCSGPVTVEVDRNTVSIGRGMAQKIIVRRM
ncbi:MAG: FeoA family protein [Euryarchaeota archaeon]|nr:FeoA family protein [Euryarchaeota archaeon]